MLKGINKQIIEIRCTNNEVFEKALLFVRGDMADLPHDVLVDRSEALFGELIPHKPAPERPKKRLFAVLAALYAAGAAIFGVLVWYGFRL